MKYERNSKSKKFSWCRDVTIKILDSGEYREVRAAQYVCDADHTDLIIYVPLAEDDKSYRRKHIIDFEDLPQDHEATGAIVQPMDADPEDDPQEARVYSLIRAENKPDYITYKCAHGSFGGQGTGIHLAKSAQDVSDCRKALGLLAMKWL